jgi:hypothetical protein
MAMLNDQMDGAGALARTKRWVLPFFTRKKMGKTWKNPGKCRKNVGKTCLNGKES